MLVRTIERMPVHSLSFYLSFFHSPSSSSCRDKVFLLRCWVSTFVPVVALLAGHSNQGNFIGNRSSCVIFTYSNNAVHCIYLRMISGSKTAITYHFKHPFIANQISIYSLCRHLWTNICDNVSATNNISTMKAPLGTIFEMLSDYLLLSNSSIESWQWLWTYYQVKKPITFFYHGCRLSRKTAFIMSGAEHPAAAERPFVHSLKCVFVFLQHHIISGWFYQIFCCMVNKVIFSRQMDLLRAHH